MSLMTQWFPSPRNFSLGRYSAVFTDATLERGPTAKILTTTGEELITLQFTRELETMLMRACAVAVMKAMD